MDLFLEILIIFWALISIKQIFFWIYLWQLKEYHIPRFLDHFSTEKGKSLIFNKLRFLKIFIFILFLIVIFLFKNQFELENTLIYILLAIYFAETVLFLKQIIVKSFKKPKITSKSGLLILLCFIVLFLYLALSQNPIDLLAFDIFLPIVVSIIVLLLQPVVVFLRNITLKKATKKIAGMKNLIVIGITGSYGKTTTKEFLTTILQAKFNVLATHEHKNSEMGIASTILNNLKPEHEIFIVEMGAYKKGGIKLLCDMVKPRLGMVTGVTVQHLSLFGSIENLLSAEGGGELAKALPSNGTLFLNAENKYCLDLFKKLNTYGKISKKLYAENGNKLNTEIWAENVEVTAKQLSFVALTRDKQMAHFNLSILGRHNLQNILGAILIAKELGMNLEEISKACENIKPEQAGIIVKEGIHKINIIDSSYSSNPDGAIADLDCLNLFGNVKKVVVMPCLIELGEKSKEMHYKIGQKIAEVCDLAIITTKDKFADIKRGATHPQPLPKERGCEVIFLEDSQEIFHKITTFCKAGDSVLLEGRVPEKLIKLLVNEK